MVEGQCKATDFACGLWEKAGGARDKRALKRKCRGCRGREGGRDNCHEGFIGSWAHRVSAVTLHNVQKPQQFADKQLPISHFLGTNANPAGVQRGRLDGCMMWRGNVAHLLRPAGASGVARQHLCED